MTDIPVSNGSMPEIKSNPQRLIWAFLAIVLIGVGLYSLFTFLKGQEQQIPTVKLADYGAVPQFDLLDQDGKPATRKNFDGHIWVADLVFTRCAGTCPMLTHAMLGLQRSLTAKSNVLLASFSADPIYDRPAVLRKYADSYGADTKYWTFMTGSIPDIYSIAKDGFHLPVDSVGGDTGQPIVHSERFALVDSRGHIRGYYDGTSNEVQQKVMMDIGDLMREERQAKEEIK